MNKGLAWAMAVVLAGLAAACNVENFECRDVEGSYLLKKNIVSVSCQKNGAPVKIKNAEFVMPNRTLLQMSQGSCNIYGNEDLFEDNLYLTYVGDMDHDDNFELKLVNPNNVNIPLHLRLSGKKPIECNYHGEVKWDGEAESETRLEGSADYDLTLRSDEGNRNCPDACQVQAEFKGEQ